MTDALTAFAALSQETRLGVFRHLVRAMPEGVAAGDLARIFAIPASTMSAHLAVLTRAGLAKAERHSRSIRYFADLDGTRAMISFLVEDCCQGQPAKCRQLVDAVLPSCCGC
ncbi:MAG TPA: metalloregulator ArsR/SmtB family transcription factor [Dongiaceae bacterium]|nr:metalloregulator ArsR/SmtB family transcription factor [Dongiaceae bacterium]